MSRIVVPHNMLHIYRVFLIINYNINNTTLYTISTFIIPSLVKFIKRQIAQFLVQKQESTNNLVGLKVFQKVKFLQQLTPKYFEFASLGEF